MLNMQYKVKEESRLDYMFTSCCIWSLLAIGSTASPYPVRRHHSRFLLVLCLETHHYLYWHVGTLNLVKGAIMQDRGPKRRIGQHIDNSRRILMCAPMCTVHATARLTTSAVFFSERIIFFSHNKST